MDSATQSLLDTAARLVEAAKRLGADAADAAVVRSRARGATVRLGKPEEIEASESEDISLRVFVGRRSASVSADARVAVDALVQRAVAMAKVSPEDPYAGLADPALLLKDAPAELDLFDPTEPSGDSLREDALALEEAARTVSGVTNSQGASAGYGHSGLVLVTSGGFSGQRTRSSFYRQVAAVAGEGVKMQQDYDFDSRLHFADLEANEAIGRRAGERAVRRVNPRMIATGRYEVVLDPRVARGAVGTLLGALNGASIARGTSFLKDRMGAKVLPDGVSVTDRPSLARRPGSRAFDGEGVRGDDLELVADGTLRNWLLDSATAREFGLATNGRASRSSGGVSPSSTNVEITLGRSSAAELIRATGTGVYVTDTIGHGANLVTGDYSAGFSGFMIENGELTFPISEMTLAGHLADMFLAMQLANDADTRFSIVAPTLRVGTMTVGGA
ncbi:TldD/PmbA family protein [Aureimonas leprariae]|uniref:TldD/PmbA family protein n=1 Tax=Plantimonas leprariae TaxID=2615207 RepID=A0A7V7PST7_9HYPH|nr:TldD/PmbA family protein [Aureimonas leprariae]KAB0682597.1 TldD/PmbA family protein [Aureimonas leprariae]